MICRHCGAGIPVDSNFCTYCGATLVPQEPHQFKLDLGKLLGDSFELYKRHFGTFCLVGLFVFGVPFCIGIVAAVAQGVANLIAMQKALVSTTLLLMGLSFLMRILQMLVQAYLTLGTIRLALYIARGGSGFQTHLIFPPLIPFLKFLGLTLLIGCIAFAVTLLSVFPIIVTGVIANMPGGANNPPAPEIIAALVAGILFFLVGMCVLIWLSIRLCLAQFFLADRNTGIIESMGYGWKVSRGNFWMLLLTMFVLGILSTLGLFLCGIGIFLTIAFVWLGSVLAYLQLTGQPNCLDYVPPIFEQPCQWEETAPE